MKISVFSTVIFTLSLLALTSCATFPYDGNGNSPGYGQGYGQPYGQDDYYNEQERRRLRDERRELERERDRAEDERRRLEEERRRLEEAQSRPTPPPPPREYCPSGFRPSEQRCSSAEKKRGCRDIRLPGGLGCVSR